MNIQHKILYFIEIKIDNWILEKLVYIINISQQIMISTFIYISINYVVSYWFHEFCNYFWSDNWNTILLLYFHYKIENN